MKRVALILSLPLVLGGCEAIEKYVESGLSEEDKAAVAEYQADIAALEQRIQQVEQESEATIETALAQAKSGDTEGLGSLLSALLDLQTQHEALVEEYQGVVGKERAVIEDAVKAKTEGFLGMLAPLIPAPAQPLLPFASTLLVFGASRRARKHALSAAKATAKGNLAETVAYLLKASGAKHSNATPAEVADELVAVAEATKDPEQIKAALVAKQQITG